MTFFLEFWLNFFCLIGEAIETRFRNMLKYVALCDRVSKSLQYLVHTLVARFVEKISS